MPLGAKGKLGRLSLSEKPKNRISGKVPRTRFELVSPVPKTGTLSS